MSRLSWTAALGGCAAAAALALGSRPLAVAGVGLLLVVAGALAWTGLARAPISATVSVEPRRAVEGERVRLRVEARREARVPVGAVAFRATLGRLGDVECDLRGGRVASATLDLGRLPRGRFELADARVELGDPFGLTAASVPVTAGAGILVRPRLVALAALFSDHGRLGRDGRRLLRRRPVGFDVHSVRQHEPGESLRRVHWPSTAKRGRLMVKELHDAPRDTVAVLLDCDPAGVAGEAPSSFDVAVRAAGSLMRALVTRGRRAVLATTSREPERVPVRALDRDLDTALDVLAAVQPDAPVGLARSLRHGRSTALTAGELVVVTATLAADAADELLRAASLRPVSVVWVDAASFAGRPTRAAPVVSRLAAAGIPTAVVRAGNDLAAALDPSLRAEAAHA